ncbi:glycine zipper family protein [Vibrio sp. ZSDE26]|uniref:Glycine zipper family protein n=1 Tax=Vibrio amylolyticus TaxID=2847292 RepID=A0A9X2BFD0_9VIBR|nr:glycine zipper family protein [Vibrio amylolyticus]MCK6261681.1 glycine zipper family protein [Vibrio amylolyticus]
MKNESLRNRIINTGAAIGVLLFAAMPTYANAHTIIFDQSQYDTTEFNDDHQQCYHLLDNVGHNEGQGAVEQGVKRGLRGATAGAIAGSVSGNSGSSAAKTGAAIGTTIGILSGRGSKNTAASANQKERDDLMRNCMQGRGYIALN